MNKSEIKICQNCKSEFTIEPDDFVFYEKMGLFRRPEPEQSTVRGSPEPYPPKADSGSWAPTWCPECRAVRRFIFRNEHFLFRNTDIRTSKEIFSTWPKEAQIPVYEHDFWWSDGWDPMEYGKEYDFSRPFFEQFKELLYTVPWDSRSIQRLVNSDYSNQASDLKNCYLCFNGGRGEDSMYVVSFTDVKDSVDCKDVEKLELCYELFACGACFKTFFTTNSANCQNVWFSRDLDNCTDCFGCVNLRHKQYHIFNVPYTKDEYFKKIQEFNLHSYSSLEKVKEQVYEFWLRQPVKYIHGVHNVNVVGDHVYGSKNVHYGFEIVGVENARYCQNIIQSADVGDFTSWGEKTELVYESVVCGEDCRRLKFCFECWPGCENLEYCVNCHSSTDLFGCVGLKKKSYCILNKQYSKDEYEILVDKIKKHMSDMPYTDKVGRVYTYGEFFPPEFSPLAYNETIAQEFFPLTKETAEKAGYKWRESQQREFKVTVSAGALPDSIHDANERVCQEVVGCMGCGKAFRIIKAEFAFYKRLKLPLPRLCYTCRYNNRIKFRNPMHWQKRRCQCRGEKSENGVFSNSGLPHSPHENNEPCPNEFETTYSPDRPEIVYCEQCYQQEVV